LNKMTEAHTHEAERENGVRNLFNVLQHQNAAPHILEDDLKAGNSDRLQNSIFVPLSIQKAYDRLPQEKKDQYKWYGEEYYGRVMDTVQNSLENTAKTLLMQVRSGLSFHSLDDDEHLVLVSVYGKEWYIEADRSAEEYQEYLNEKASKN